MGVYYVCTRCHATLQLAPGSPGFGKMRVPCVICGGEARYAPGGPAPGSQVVQSSGAGGPTPALPPGAMPRVGGEEPVANPTVPLETPSALLALDAQETAATIPVEGLSEEEIARYLGQSAAQSFSPSSDPNTVRGDEPDIEEQIPTRAVAGLADRDIQAYASELYPGQDPGAAAKQAARPAPAPAPQAPPKVKAPEPVRAPEPAQAPAKPKSRASFDGEPGVSPSMFNVPGIGGSEPGWASPGASAKVSGKLDGSGPVAPLGLDRFTGEFPMAAPPSSRPSKGNAGLIIGVTLVVVLVLAAVGLGIAFILQR